MVEKGLLNLTKYKYQPGITRESVLFMVAKWLMTNNAENLGDMNKMIILRIYKVLALCHSVFKHRKHQLVDKHASSMQHRGCDAAELGKNTLYLDYWNSLLVE